MGLILVYVIILIGIGPENKTSSVENAIIATVVTDTIVVVAFTDFSILNFCDFIILKILYLIILTMLDL